MKNWLKGLTSRKFLLALISAAVAFANFMWELGLTVEQVFAVVSPLVAFIFAEGAGDVASRYGEAKSGAVGAPVIPPEIESILAEYNDETAASADQPIVPGGSL